MLSDDAVRVTLEMPDGQTWSGKALMASVNIEREPIELMTFDRWEVETVPGMMSWSMELTGNGELTFTEREEFHERVRKQRTSNEWRCDFCGSVNQREQTRCCGCGGFRSFLYE